MKLNCFILRTTTVAGLGVPIFRVFTVLSKVYTVVDGIKIVIPWFVHLQVR